MKRIILSRKGFDSKAGGGASPIFSDGRFFSIPIPQDHPSPKKYEDLDFYGTSGAELLKEASSKVKPTDYCHNDPLLNEDIGIFGQASSSQTELKNNSVGPGDLFLFFGWFKNFSIKGRDLHHLFGWLQVEKIIKGNKEILNFLSKEGLSHPHGTTDIAQYKNNTIYIASKNLTFSDRVRDLKGHGRFKKTAKELILTEKGKTRSKWRFPQEYFSDTKNLFRNRLKWKDEKNCLLDCIGIGQEFILNANDNPSVVAWASHLINIHGRD